MCQFPLTEPRVPSLYLDDIRHILTKVDVKRGPGFLQVIPDPGGVFFTFRSDR